MTTVFSKALLVGQSYEQVLDKAFSSEYVLEPATRDEQRQGIDRIFYSADGGQISVEYKADLKAARTGNAFIETFSVDTKNIKGWAYTSKADVLAYYIPALGLCHLIDFVDLRSCLKDWRTKYRTIRTSPELNEGYRTHGLLVPLTELVNLSFETWNI
jgi:hypothetical protein